MAFKGKVFFGNYDTSREQWLFDSLIRECIDIYGEEMYYLPRTLTHFDRIYGADDLSVYKSSFLLPFYIENVMGFGGDKTLYGKFGLEVRDRVIFSVSQSVFSEEVGAVTGQVRPNESDLIYFPLNNKCFQIKHVEKFEMYYPLGSLYTWKMDCELFEYGGERMQTGIEAIDTLQAQFSMVQQDWALLTEDGDMLMTEDNFIIVDERAETGRLVAADDSAQIEKESSEFIDFSVADPFSEGHIGTPTGV